MQILLSFLIGYFVGAKAGAEQFDEVVASARAVAESDEFHSLVQSSALPCRRHAALAGRSPRRDPRGDGRRQRGGAGAADDGAIF